MAGPVTFTYTWSIVQSSYDRPSRPAGARKFSRTEDAWLADILYFDWNGSPLRTEVVIDGCARLP